MSKLVALLSVVTLGGSAFADPSAMSQLRSEAADAIKISGIELPAKAPVAVQAVPVRTPGGDNVGACTIEMDVTATSFGTIPIIAGLAGAKLHTWFEGTATMKCAIDDRNFRTYHAKVSGGGPTVGIQPGIQEGAVPCQDANGNYGSCIKTKYKAAGLQVPTLYRFWFGRQASATYYAVAGGVGGAQLQISPGVNQNVEFSIAAAGDSRPSLTAWVGALKMVFTKSK